MVKVTQSRKGEGCGEIETHSETKCEEGDPKRKSVAVGFSMRGKQVSPWAWGKEVKAAEETDLRGLEGCSALKRAAGESICRDVN